MEKQNETENSASDITNCDANIAPISATASVSMATNSRQEVSDYPEFHTMEKQNETREDISPLGQQRNVTDDSASDITSCDANIATISATASVFMATNSRLEARDYPESRGVDQNAALTNSSSQDLNLKAVNNETTVSGPPADVMDSYEIIQNSEADCASSNTFCPAEVFPRCLEDEDTCNRQEVRDNICKLDAYEKECSDLKSELESESKRVTMEKRRIIEELDSLVSFRLEEIKKQIVSIDEQMVNLEELKAKGHNLISADKGWEKFNQEFKIIHEHQNNMKIASSEVPYKVNNVRRGILRFLDNISNVRRGILRFLDNIYLQGLKETVEETDIKQPVSVNKQNRVKERLKALINGETKPVNSASKVSATKSPSARQEYYGYGGTAYQMRELERHLQTLETLKDKASAAYAGFIRESPFSEDDINRTLLFSEFLNNQISVNRQEDEWEWQLMLMNTSFFLKNVVEKEDEGQHENRLLNYNEKLISKVHELLCKTRSYTLLGNANIMRGLRNFENTCFINAVMQSLFQTFLLHHQLDLRLAKYPLLPLEEAFLKLSAAPNDEHKLSREHALEELLIKFREKVPRFFNAGQHDSHDFFMHFVDCLRQEERDIRKKFDPQGTNILKILTSVDEVFGGHFVTTYTCQKCKEPYILCEPFIDLSLPIPSPQSDPQSRLSNDPSNPTSAESQNITGAQFINTPLNDSSPQQPTKAINSSSISTKSTKFDNFMSIFRQSNVPIPEPIHFYLWEPKTTLEQCLHRFTREEFIEDEYLCQHCPTPDLSSAYKQTLIYNPPAILVLHLKRFQQTDAGFTKRSSQIEYKELLDIWPYRSSNCMGVHHDDKHVWYSLYAVVVHSGSLTRGHYTAYIKQRQSKICIDESEKFLQKDFLDRDKFQDEEMKKKCRLCSKNRMEDPEVVPGQWFCANDENIRKITTKEALTQEASLLFYERV